MDRTPDLELLRGVCRRGIPPLPASHVRLALELAGDDDSNNALLIEQLEADPRLRFGLLAGANSTMFCGARPIKSVRQAIGQLGRRKCFSLLWFVTLSDFLRSWTDMHERARDKLWRHSLLTGVLAQQLIVASGLEIAGDGLSAGMAHDFGHMLLVNPGARLGVVWHEEHDSLVERNAAPRPERDHCRLGGSLLAFWDAPAEHIASALHHHDPAAAEARHRPLVAAVRLADLLAEYLDREPPAKPLRLETDAAWQELSAMEPWGRVSHFDQLAIERLPESLLVAEHLANLLGG